MMLWIIPALWAAAIILAALVFCTAPGRMSLKAKHTASVFKGLCCAHRGLHTQDQRIPENSVPAFMAAREAGYGAELDVHLSKDGKVVVFHDDGLERACGIDRPVGSLDYGELAALSLFGTREHIPLLTEVLEALGDTPLIVEIKSAGAKNAELCAKTLDLLRANGVNWCVKSFDPRVGGWYRKNAPDVLRGQLSWRPSKLDTVSRPTAFLIGNLLINFISRPHFISFGTGRRPLTVKLCGLMGAMKMVWTVRPGDDTAKYEAENDTVIFEYITPNPHFK
jgi:glycerophosphoryl diester phosphodiesterase